MRRQPPEAKISLIIITETPQKDSPKGGGLSGPGQTADFIVAG